jgi:HK97 family phage portal protein
MPEPEREVTKTDVSDAINKAASAAIGPILIGQLWGREEVPLVNDYKGYAGEYEKLAWVYSCVYAIAAGIGIVPWYIIDGEPGKGDPVPDDHPAVKLFRDPNEDMAWYDLCEYLVSYLELGGDSYLEVARDRLGKPRELYPLRPDRITIVPRKDGRGVQFYRFKLTPYAKNKVDFEPEDVVHILYFNPLDDWYGLSTLSAAALTMQMEHYTIEYNKGFFERDATPPGYLYTDQTITKEQAEEIGQRWRRNLAGVANRHKIPVLPTGLKFMPIGQSARDMQFLNQREWNRQEILSVFGVPPVKVGLMEGVKYANYKLQEAAFYRDTLQPKMKKVAGKLTKFLRREFGENLTFWFDPTEFMTADADVDANRMVKLVSIGALTPNQVISNLRLGSPYPEGDAHFISTQFVPVGESPMVAADNVGAAVAEEKYLMDKMDDAVDKIDGLNRAIAKIEV